MSTNSSFTMRDLRSALGHPDSENELASIAAALRRGEQGPIVSVRTLLHWFSAQRRGWYVVDRIREALKSAGLRTEPEFSGAFIDSDLRFSLIGEESEGDVIEDSNSDVETAERADPTFRISRLAAANQSLISVRPDSPLNEAVTKMLAGDFSQLPVVTSERDVKGVVTWVSIGAKLALGAKSKDRECREFMEPHHEIRADASLFSAISVIAKYGYVLVRANEGKISGIVTSTDLSLQFRQLSEPFLLIGEIENYVRMLISKNFEKCDLVDVRSSGDEGRTVEGVDDLTFGEYVRLLEKPANWAKLDISLDRKEFCARLEKVRRIRNDVMHFDPDGVIPADLDELRDFANFLQALQEYEIL